MILKQLLQRKAELEEQMKDIKALQDLTMEQIETELADHISSMREMQSKEFGAINFTVSGIKVTHTVPKKVKWDQDRLAHTYLAILQSGDTPSNYMKLEFSVPEKLYDSFGDEVKNIFAEARTVDKGKPTYKFEEVG